jgi:protocatechuate 3,4-dioxygenase beta subunit
LAPGKYRLVENQPGGYLDVGARAGTVEGQEIGEVAMLGGRPNVLSEISLPLGNTHAVNYDFCEVRPASLSGHVWHDRNDDGIRGSGEEGIANVMIQITRIGSKPGQEDPFANTPAIFVRTNANGFYEATGLPPGIYEVVEINTYPAGSNPLSGYIDGKDSLGQVKGEANGSKVNDRFNQIMLCADDAGVQYDFGELKPTSISGYVSLATPEGDCVSPSDPSYRPIAGVTIELYDSVGQLVATTTTNANGLYSFDNLAPGTYSVVEVQPAGYLDGDEGVGTVEGAARGSLSGNDRISQITLTSGQAGVNYEFCEHEPASLCGTVWHDVDNDGIRESGELGIANALIELRTMDGTLVATTQTDATGRYCFNNLYAGEYCIREIQPAGYVDGKDSLGSVDDAAVGVRSNDEFCSVTLLGGQHGDDYDFGEIKLGRISGYVHTDNNGNCILDAQQGELPLSGVTMQLLNNQGQVIGTTTTDANGFYKFDQLLPDSYSVRQLQPNGYFTVGQKTGMPEGGGTGTGDASVVNQITGIQVGSGAVLVQYNFCEQAPAKIQGRVWEDGPAFRTEDGELPTNYRGQRDHIYQPGTDRALAGVKMTLWFYNDIAGGSLNPRPVTLADVLPEFYSHLNGLPASSPVYIVTDANGEYCFGGLKAGNYIVLQEQPTGFADANDVPGTTTGFTYNSEIEVLLAPTILSETFGNRQLLDSINAIQVAAGGISLHNNFTEVSVSEIPDEPPGFPPPPNPPRGNPPPPLPPGPLGLFLAGAQPANVYNVVGSSVALGIDIGPAADYTWHLSVINAGDPRGDAQVAQSRESVWMNASFSDDTVWRRSDMDDATWSFGEKIGERFALKPAGGWFGMLDGFPLAGDWNGDGVDEIGVFWNGFWFIDINANQQFDKDDLVAKLGSGEDQAVVGDWDGDGKDDIGIFGPVWPNDEQAIAHDPGLPNPANRLAHLPKNPPPRVEDATDGARIMRLTSAGKARADLIDHVFRYGRPGDVAIAGDWNGSGIRGIGVFNRGAWLLDSNGNGRLDTEDARFEFGGEGDLPVVGDFNGDGVEEIGIYHQGRWTIDINGNRELDATDLVFQLGDATDLPVAGDFDGDGVDEPALYHRSAAGRVAGL